MFSRSNCLLTQIKRLYLFFLQVSENHYKTEERIFVIVALETLVSHESTFAFSGGW